MFNQQLGGGFCQPPECGFKSVSERSLTQFIQRTANPSATAIKNVGVNPGGFHIFVA